MVDISVVLLVLEPRHMAVRGRGGGSARRVVRPLEARAADVVVTGNTVEAASVPSRQAVSARAAPKRCRAGAAEWDASGGRFALGWRMAIVRFWVMCSGPAGAYEKTIRGGSSRSPQFHLYWMRESADGRFIIR